MTKTIFITGTNRGLGLGLTRHYVAAGHKVYATTRNESNSKELLELADKSPNLSVIHIELTDQQQIKSIAAEFAQTPIDIFINNAAICQNKSSNVTDVNENQLLETMKINVWCPFFITTQFMPSILQSNDKLLVTISSAIGSITRNNTGAYYSYSASKAAVNMIMKDLSIHYDDQGLRSLLLHPGWVRTDMGGPDATLSIEKSIAGMTSVIDNYKQNTGIEFIQYDGQPLPW